MKATRLILSLFGATALAATAPATLVTLDTSSLTQGGTYYVDFQLNDGSGVGNHNNTALIQSFNFGSGAAAGSANLFGGVTGSLLTSVAMTDTDPFNEFYQSFTAGNFLSFDLQLTNNANAPAPDIFGFALLDVNLVNLPTFSLGTDQFLTVELTGAPLAYQTFAGVGGIPAPTAVPEAGSTALLVSVAALGLVVVRRRVRAQPAA